MSRGARSGTSASGHHARQCKDTTGEGSVDRWVCASASLRVVQALEALVQTPECPWARAAPLPGGVPRESWLPATCSCVADGLVRYDSVEIEKIWGSTCRSSLSEWMGADEDDDVVIAPLSGGHVRLTEICIRADTELRHRVACCCSRCSLAQDRQSATSSKATQDMLQSKGVNNQMSPASVFKCCPLASKQLSAAEVM